MKKCIKKSVSKTNVKKQILKNGKGGKAKKNIKKEKKVQRKIDALKKEGRKCSGSIEAESAHFKDVYRQLKELDASHVLGCTRNDLIKNMTKKSSGDFRHMRHLADAVDVELILDLEPESINTYHIQPLYYLKDPELINKAYQIACGTAGGASKLKYVHIREAVKNVKQEAVDCDEESSNENIVMESRLEGSTGIKSLWGKATGSDELDEFEEFDRRMAELDKKNDEMEENPQSYLIDQIETKFENVFDLTTEIIEAYGVVDVIQDFNIKFIGLIFDSIRESKNHNAR